MNTTAIIISFPSTTAAMQMRSAAAGVNLPGGIIPVPRDMSASCGMAWCAPVEREADTRALLERLGIPFQSIEIRPYKGAW